MGFINIFIANPARVYAENSQLVLEGEKRMVYPLSDINSVVAESMRTTFTAHALTKIAENNGVVFFCDERHLPTAVFTPYNSHCRRLKMLRLQQSVKKPLLKQIWKNIIEAKILNQAQCLEYCGKNKDADKLREIAARVYSGDGTNCEAEAAAYYFRSLYGSSFTRGAENVINAALNYGYAIIRGLIARTVVAHGLEPNFGVFHASELNEFNLADDFIEPFRPMVDLYAAKYIDASKTCLDTEIKTGLYNLVNCEVLMSEEREPLSYAIEKVVTGYINAIQNESGNLRLPKLLPLSVHTYE